MEEHLKYFVPEISDFCIGYEYEQLVTPLSESLSKSEPEWMKCKFPDPFTIDRILLLYERKEQLRVSYLTKEQIEAEGWKHDKKHNDVKHFYKNEIYLRLYIGYHHEEIIFHNISIFNENGVLFRGECKDINTFRKIIKLLGI
jgi:hypothetical protein